MKAFPRRPSFCLNWYANSAHETTLSKDDFSPDATYEMNDLDCDKMNVVAAIHKTNWMRTIPKD